MGTKLKDFAAQLNAAEAKIDEELKTARKTHELGGVRIDFNLRPPQKQMWIVKASGEVTYVPTVAHELACSDGNKAGEDVPKDPHFTLAGAIAVMHTHPRVGGALPGS